MDGYDLDDTLAKVNYKQAGYKNLTQIYADAPVIYKPDTPFVVITARSIRNSADKSATEKWLQQNEPNYRRAYYVSGSDAVKKKADIIQRLNLATYTDNNAKNLAELRTLVPNVALFIMQGGKRTPFR
jgi:hypothetical protein